jgi:hypothetical protein
MPTIGRGYVDLDAGVFYRRAVGARETKKRQPPVRLPPRLLAHLRRWQRRRLALRSVIEWNGQPVRRLNKAFRSVRQAAGLGADVVPHTLRHTAITWQAQLGVPMHEICGFFGITPEMFDRVYGPPPSGLPGECCERAEPSPDNFPTVIPQPNVNERPRAYLYFMEIIEFFCSGTRSGRGGRRFKSCHSYHLSHIGDQHGA